MAANVTNTVALVFNGIGSVWGSRPELAGQGEWIKRIVAAAVLGGAAGAVLLLSTPAEGFEKVVPVLLGFASVAILLPRAKGPEDHVPGRPGHAVRKTLEGGTIFLITIYGGYFGAASGVLLLALLLHAGGATLAHASAGKNLVLGVANCVAALIFALFAPVSWAAVLPMGIGGLLGARLGPIVIRHAPATPLRLLIGTGGMVLAAKLAVDTY